MVVPNFAGPSRAPVRARPGRRLNPVPQDRAAARAAWEPALALGLVMTMAAGFVDALGYARLGQLYVSFMSGNSTRLGVALAGDDFDVVRWAAAAIAVFVAGAFCGTLLVELFARTKLPVVLGCEVAALLAALALARAGVGRAAVLPVAFAMGLQNAIYQVAIGTDTGKSFITGTLFGVGGSLAKFVLGKGHGVQAGIHALSWRAFTGGVVRGACSLAWLGFDAALVLVAGVLAMVAVVVSVGVGPA
ncbi:MAG: DUF1275 family protein [Alphaproteobacteria bacterium]|nr:DUF1275 family protein [Alphaproteobacteria bacterium]